jgi:hypothetical protein
MLRNGEDVPPELLLDMATFEQYDIDIIGI